MKDLSLLPKASPFIHTEDLYLFDDTGAVVLSRCDKSKKISNIFSVISEHDRHFITKKSEISEPYSYLLIESKIGPLFILRSLYPYFKLLLAIAPRFDENAIYAIAKSRNKNPSFFPTDECAARIGSEEVACIALFDEHKLFLSRLDGCFRNASGYLTKRFSFEELLEELKNCVLSLSALIGSEFTVSFDESIYKYREPNRFSCEGFLLSIIHFGMLARRCSADRSANIVFSADEQGFYFTIDFDVCSDFADVDLVNGSQEILAFKKQMATHAFPCYTRYFTGNFKATCFCWRSVTEGDLKTTAELIYENDELKEGDKIWLDPIRPQSESYRA